jgi:hypothetical protein
MVDRVGVPLLAIRASLVIALVIAFAGCGSSGGGGSAGGRPAVSANLTARGTPASCARTVLATLRQVAKRIYHEGVSSERTRRALRLISRSVPLRAAVERGDARAVRAAAAPLLATGQITNLRVLRGGQVLADLGPPAVAPLPGTLTSSQGAPIGSFVTSVWSNEGLLEETNGLVQGVTVLRANGHTVGGSLELGPGALPGALPVRGSLTVNGVPFEYTSFPASVYPSGPLRVYVFRSIPSTAHLCGPTNEDTLVNTLSRIATLIYQGEAGHRTVAQVNRVARDAALLSAVSQRDPLATRQAVVGLLNQHIVRLRVSSAGRLLSDVGGPFVLAPVPGSLRLGGRTIGTFVLSIQDDEGYLRLAKRLAGLPVLMYMGPRLVLNSLGPAPGAVPANGRFRYRGRDFRTFTFTEKAFPAGPLRITVLIPIPYS